MLLNARRQKQFNEKDFEKAQMLPLSPSQWLDTDSLEVKGRVGPQGVFFGQINENFQANSVDGLTHSD